VQRGLDKKAPFHRRNSVADALLIEIYASAIASADLEADPTALSRPTPMTSRSSADRIWYSRSLSHEYRLADAGDEAERRRHADVAGPARRGDRGSYR
jgi:hypothetical protein